MRERGEEGGGRGLRRKNVVEEFNSFEEGWIIDLLSIDVVFLRSLIACEVMRGIEVVICPYKL